MFPAPSHHSLSNPSQFPTYTIDYFFNIMSSSITRPHW